MTILALASLLLAEIVALTLAFDTEHLDRVAGSTGLADWPAQTLRLAIAIAFVTAALGGRGLWAAWMAQYRAQGHPTRRRRLFLSIHAVALAFFVWISAAFFAAGPSIQESPVLWAVAWAVSAATVFLAWSHALLPASGWRHVLEQHRASVASGAAVGSVAWTLGFVSATFWQPLARYTYRIVEWALNLRYADTISDPATLTLGTPRFTVHIASECSGYEGIGLIVVFLCVYLFLCRRELRFPAALLVLPLGIASVWVLNLLRIVALISIGDAGWDQVARGGFTHKPAGWRSTPWDWGLSRRFRDSAGSRPAAVRFLRSATSDSTSPYLAPFLVLLAAAMVTGALTGGLDWLYPMRLLALGGAFWVFRHTSASLELVGLLGWSGVRPGVIRYLDGAAS